MKKELNLIGYFKFFSNLYKIPITKEVIFITSYPSLRYAINNNLE